MAQTNSDELALILREMSQRFGATAFTDRRRLVSLLNDRLPDGRRDIRVVAAAVDERVFDSLARCRPEQLGLEIERLAANLENGLGIRSDVAVSVLQACAYGLQIGPLPSQAGAGLAAIVPLPRTSQGGDAWIGLSEPVAAAATTAAAPAVPGATAAAPKGGTPWKKVAAWGIPAVILLGVGLNQLGVVTVKDDEPKPAPVPQPSPVSQPVVVPTLQPPAIQPMPQPVSRPMPQPAPQPAPQPLPQPGPQPSPAPSAGPVQSPVYGEETIDFGVPAQPMMKQQVGMPTPLTVPGGHTVTTVQIVNELQAHHRMLMVDSLADQHSQTIVGAVYLPYSGQYGMLTDATQTRLTSDLNRLTDGNSNVPIVFFCQGVRCWESYNAVLRARAAGFPNVYWYRGGLQAWQQAGLPMQPVGG